MAFYRGRYRWLPLALSIGAALFGLCFTVFSDTLVTGEKGLSPPVSGLLIGYWLWLASLAAACLAARFPPGRSETTTARL